jgi:TetR/AcrR family transcriptional regulator
MTTEKQPGLAVTTRDPQRTRAKILRAATVLFAAKGPDATPVDEIASRAGVNKRMLYHYFGSKRELYQNVLKNTFSRLDQISEEVIRQTTDAQGLIEAIFREYFGFLRQNPEFIALMNWENSTQAKDMKSVASFSPAKRYVEVLHQALEREPKKFNIHEDVDIPFLIMACMSLCTHCFTNGHTMSAAFGMNLDDPEYLEQWIRNAQRLVINGVLNREDPQERTGY